MASRDEARELDKWRDDAMKTAEAIVNDRPVPAQHLRRLAKEFIVQRLIEDGLRATNARLVALLGECRSRVMLVRALCPVGSFSNDYNSKIIARIEAELGDA